MDLLSDRQSLQAKHFNWIVLGTINLAFQMDFTERNDANYANLIWVILIMLLQTKAKITPEIEHWISTSCERQGYKLLMNLNTDMVYCRLIRKVAKWTSFWYILPTVASRIFAIFSVKDFGHNSILHFANISVSTSCH